MNREMVSGFFKAISRESGPVITAWVIEGEAAGAKALYRWNGESVAPVFCDTAFPAAFRPGVPGTAGIVAFDGARIFLEPIQLGRRLVVCGAGHVAQCVIRLGAMLGFEVTAIEDREAYAEKARSCGASRVICEPFADALDGIPGDGMTAFVVMTREHVHDMDCLRRILRKPWAYAGMMGSHGRAARIRQLLLSEGFDPRRVEALRMPIGVAIGARTPEEIAVSVAAELISVMNTVDTGEGYPPEMLEALASLDEPAVLAMIVAKDGEAPRRPGTKMLVRGDGSFLGTTGGGTAEAEILEAAGEMLREGKPASLLRRCDLKKGVVQCGGEIDVLLLYLDGDRA